MKTPRLPAVAAVIALAGCNSLLGLEELPPLDGGVADGAIDTGSTDTGSTDTGSTDSGSTDSAPTDSGPTDGGDAGCGEATCAPSCAVGGSGRDTCGPSNSDNCCRSPLVSGIDAATFSRSYDKVTFTDPKYKARVTSFRLDKYEVTVGRFRRFVDAVVAGYRPPAGSGKHTHLAGGAGLVSTAGGNEAGWDSTWDSNLPKTLADWTSTKALDCPDGTWTGGDDRRPVGCLTWYQAYAFCIWDGGFLPSEAEWNYAAAGGLEQRAYPWGATAPSATYAAFQCNVSGGTCKGSLSFAPVGSKPAGNGLFGQSDLAGNVMEWVLDWLPADHLTNRYAETSCLDCANLARSEPTKSIRGGSYSNNPDKLLVGERDFASPEWLLANIGARCARAP